MTVSAAAAIVGLYQYVVSPHFTAARDRLAAIAAGIPASKSAGLLEKQRENLILMADASRSFKLASAPKVSAATTPPAAAGAVPVGASPPPVSGGPIPSPGTAQAIAYRMLSSFGFSPGQQFGCLNNIWSRESGWSVTAANASGAYGIPQALPGSKMASAGPNWQTSASTQIRWGLGYIKGRYGSPCSAWGFWEAHGWY